MLFTKIKFFGSSIVNKNLTNEFIIDPIIANGNLKKSLFISSSNLL